VADVDVPPAGAFSWVGADSHYILGNLRVIALHH
jgi:hypothetical protein